MVSLIAHVTILALPNFGTVYATKANGNQMLQATLSKSFPPITKPEFPSESSSSQEFVTTAQSNSNIQPKPTSILRQQHLDQSRPREFNSPGNNEAERVPLYFASNLLDRPPVPYSAPNPVEHLNNVSIPTLPIRLRLYIDASGKVARIDMRVVEYLDEAIFNPVKEMFYATTFIPGNIKGTDVPSYLDIEVQLSEFPP